MTDAFGDLAPGTLLADRFDVETVLGRGGCATVFQAHDRMLDRAVAVKLLNAEASTSVDAARFDREIRLTARLVHPGIVPLFDSGVLETRRFYVMPCLTGNTLRHLIEQEHTCDIRQTVRLCGDVAEALSYAHSMGVVHRDIKPENIFLSDGRALVAATPNYLQATERLEMACHRSGRFDDAFAARRTMLGTQKLYDRLAKLTEVFESDGWEATREQDLRVELAQLLERAKTEDPFKDPQGSRQLSDRLIIAYGELGEWHHAMDWVERGYYLRPGRLIRVLTDLPFDRRGLAVDRRYARLLRTAGLDSLL